jgi:3-hydroxyacyl-CoA dehydrogenase/enoyl-CoA hydratase/3-hydroxybutyryl-CoA epimerase
VLGLSRERSTTRSEMILERMVLLMINEAARCLEEKVVSDAGMLDLAIVFGAGFPPYRGGLLRHADTLGLPHIESRLAALAAERGPRFSPATMIRLLAQRGETFTQPIVTG